MEVSSGGMEQLTEEPEAMKLKVPHKQQKEIPCEMIDGRDRHAPAEHSQPQLLPGSIQGLEEVRTTSGPKELITDFATEELPPDVAQVLANVRTPPGLKELVTDFDTKDISEERVLGFLRRGLLEFLEMSMIEEAKSSVFLPILAADLILSGEDTKAVYIILYFALMKELVLREPKHLREILDTSSTLEQACAHCFYMELLVGAHSRPELIEHLIDHLQTTIDNLSSQSMELTGLGNMLRALQEEQVPGQKEVLLHSLKQPEEALSELIRISLANVDDGSKSTAGYICYSDATLGWVLKTNTKHLPGNYFRVVHKGRSLFLSSSGKKTLKDLGIINGDELLIGGVCRSENTSSDVPKIDSKSKPAAKKRHKKLKRVTKKHCKSPRTTSYALNDKQLAEQHKREHSQSMNPVLEELDPRLKDIRNQLNKLALENDSPKVRGHATKRTDLSRVASTFPMTDERLAKTAGKVAYPILVGEASNLYKTSTMPHGHLVAIDLHGCSKEEALEKLDNSLPVWVDAAMRGSAPWVLGVDIICGGGSQILSEAVKGWIRVNVHAANRPKGVV